MIKAVIFDCFGVLTEDAWHSFKSTLSPSQSQKAQKLMHRSCAAQITYEDFITGVSKISGWPPPEIRSFIVKDGSKNLPLLAYIKGLKERGYKIGLLSNIANNWIRESFLTAKEQELFDEMIISFEVGVAKPDPEIFNLSCRRLGVKNQEAVLVDDIKKHCAVARKQGMAAIHYENFQQMKQDLEAILAN